MSGKNMGRSELFPVETRELPYWTGLSGCLTRYSTHRQVTRFRKTCKNLLMIHACLRLVFLHDFCPVCMELPLAF